MNSFVSKMICSRCGAEYEVKGKVLMCKTQGCLGRIDIYFDLERVKEKLTKNKLVMRKRNMWRYKELLPVEKVHVNLEEGGTPLLKCDKLAGHLGLRELFIKDETRNPTGSFKDRPITVGVNKAVELREKVVVAASSGNAAVSLAAFSAKAGLKCYAFVPEEASQGKIAQLLFYGANVFRVKRVKEDEDPTVILMMEAVEKLNWYPCPSFGPFNPYQAEGPKTISFEVAEQLNWEPPDWVFIQIGAGGLIRGVWKGFKELLEMGWVERVPGIVGVQPVGCAPVIRAYRENMDPHRITPWKNPKTIATGLEDPYPWDGDAALKAMKETDGFGVEVSDEEIIEASKVLAGKEGVFASPSGVASLAGLVKALSQGLVDKSDKVLVLATATGLKDPAVIMSSMKTPPTINPDISELKTSR